jgi:hypothetical protein
LAGSEDAAALFTRRSQDEMRVAYCEQIVRDVVVIYAERL